MGNLPETFINIHFEQVGQVADTSVTLTDLPCPNATSHISTVLEGKQAFGNVVFCIPVHAPIGAGAQLAWQITNHAHLIMHSMRTLLNQGAGEEITQSSYLISVIYCSYSRSQGYKCMGLGNTTTGETQGVGPSTCSRKSNPYRCFNSSSASFLVCKRMHPCVRHTG